MSTTSATVEGYNLVITTHWENLTCPDDVERLYLPGPFKSLNAMRRRNEETGHYYFSRDTMYFFRSRVSADIFAGRMFVTSERNVGMGQVYPRLYSVRAMRDDGTIADVSNFQQFETLDSAKRYARSLARMVSNG